ncbi:glycosyltransferase [Stutzerimonas zhaodongensis]|uniref:Glycosyltransferase n=2 Tax=Stutzerimonas zhaodongensis TaxID=1176257 RepID=A0A3M2HWS7_9GAMM|nr:glycosyltransferase [Stutzerimonas zhaodongensis]
MLHRHGHVVEYFWDESWAGGAAVSWEGVENHDVVIMFQAYSPILERYYRTLHPNVIFIPMLDQFGVWQGPLFNLARFWEPFQGSKVISFSNAVHAISVGAGIASHHCRYYQPVAERDLSDMQGLHGFFWLRREDQIPWKTIRSLIAGSNFDSFHIHLASDPGSPEPVLPSEEDIKRYRITTSTWFQDKVELYGVLEKANVFFASRMEEGIGQSFLEALARGQCVVAPNNGTMNEYILHGMNGLLYESTDPQPLNFYNVQALGSAGRQSVSLGQRAWQEGEERLVRYIVTPSEHLYVGKYVHQSVSPTFCSRIESHLRYVARRNSIARRAFSFLRR